MEFLDTSFLKNDEITLRQIELAEGDPAKKWAPAYHFTIYDSTGAEIGGCCLRLGHSETLYYAGNIGYKIDKPYRGHHYAGKACKLLLELARRHGMEYVIITCNPDNLASRKTCEYAGGKLLEIAKLPEDNPMRLEDGETEKCIYRFNIPKTDEQSLY